MQAFLEGEENILTSAGNFYQFPPSPKCAVLMTWHLKNILFNLEEMYYDETVSYLKALV